MSVIPMPKIDWSNKDQVVAFARKLGKGMTVCECTWKGKPSYKICHTERTDLWKKSDRKVVLHT